MFISEFSIRRPVTATMMTVFLLVMGVIGLKRLGVDYFPAVDFPALTISTVWENARPEEIDNNISDELEDAIGEVSGIKHIASRSVEGASFVIVNFKLTRNIDMAAQEVQEKVSGRTGALPDAYRLVFVTAKWLVFEIYFTIAVIYLIMTVTLSQIVNLMERRLKLNG